MSKSTKSRKPAKKIDTTTHAGGVKFTEKRPGVIAAMVEMLQAASKTKPVTKSTMLAKLVKLFPERGEEKLKATLMMQVPAGLRYEKGIVLDSTDTEGGKGYWVAKIDPTLKGTKVSK